MVNIIYNNLMNLLNLERVLYWSTVIFLTILPFGYTLFFTIKAFSKLNKIFILRKK